MFVASLHVIIPHTVHRRCRGEERTQCAHKCVIPRLIPNQQGGRSHLRLLSCIVVCRWVRPVQWGFPGPFPPCARVCVCTRSTDSTSAVTLLLRVSLVLLFAKLQLALDLDIDGAGQSVVWL